MRNRQYLCNFSPQTNIIVNSVAGNLAINVNGIASRGSGYSVIE
jgi:hypothetical protein